LFRPDLTKSGCQAIGSSSLTGFIELNHSELAGPIGPSSGLGRAYAGVGKSLEYPQPLAGWLATLEGADMADGGGQPQGAAAYSFLSSCGVASLLLRVRRPFGGAVLLDLPERLDSSVGQISDRRLNVARLEADVSPGSMHCDQEGLMLTLTRRGD
jgi:hypothetical protein